MRRGRSGFLCAALCWVALGCAAQTFDPEMATYLGGGARGEEWNAVDIAPDGTIVVAGTAPEFAAGGAPEHGLMGGGYGIVLRIRPDPYRLLSVTRIGDWIDDLEVDGQGRIAVTGSFGTGLIATNGGALLWRDGSVLRGTRAAQFRNQTSPFKNERYTKRVSRVCAGADGTVASVHSEEKVWNESAPKKGRLYVWDRDGSRLCAVEIANCKYPQDIAISATQKLVYVGGFNTYAFDSVHMKNHPIHMPFLAACSYDGRPRWIAYDFTARDCYAQNTYADSRVQRLQVGRDGFLYMGGYIHGGDYVWKHHPFDVRRRVEADTGYDAYSTASNMGRGIDQAYFARFDPATGEILKAQVLLCRQKPDGGGKPSQIQITGIHADTTGRTYLAGYCEAFIRQRDRQTVAGRPVGAYHKPEVFLLGVSPDFKSRSVWTVFSAERCEAAAWGLTCRDERAALVGEVYEGSAITTTNAPLTNAMAHVDGYLVYWKTR